MQWVCLCPQRPHPLHQILPVYGRRLPNCLYLSTCAEPLHRLTCTNRPRPSKAGIRSWSPVESILIPADEESWELSVTWGQAQLSTCFILRFVLFAVIWYYLKHFLLILSGSTLGKGDAQQHSIQVTPLVGQAVRHVVKIWSLFKFKNSSDH